MEYYINPIWFYLADVSMALKMVFLFVGVSFSLILVILWCILFDNYSYSFFDSEDEELIKKKKILKIFSISAIIMIVVGCFLPSTSACEKMIIANCLTKENVSEMKSETYELIDHILDRFEGKEDK